MVTLNKLHLMLLFSLALGSQVFAEVTPTGKASSESVKNYNISFNPIWIPLGSFDGLFEVATTNNITLGVYTSIFQYSSGDTKISSTGIGGKMNYYWNHSRWTDGWYLSPFVQFIPTTWKENFGSVSFISVSAGSIAGYYWGFESGLNIMVGGGVSYSTASNSIEIDGRNVSAKRNFTGFWPAAELRLGYSF